MKRGTHSINIDLSRKSFYESQGYEVIEQKTIKKNEVAKSNQGL